MTELSGATHNQHTAAKDRTDKATYLVSSDIGRRCLPHRKNEPGETFNFRCIKSILLTKEKLKGHSRTMVQTQYVTECCLPSALLVKRLVQSETAT